MDFYKRMVNSHFHRLYYHLLRIYVFIKMVKMDLLYLIILCQLGIISSKNTLYPNNTNPTLQQ